MLPRKGVLSLRRDLSKNKRLPQELPQAKCCCESFHELPRAQREPLSEVVAGGFPKLFPYLYNFVLAPIYLTALLSLENATEHCGAQCVPYGKPKDASDTPGCRYCSEYPTVWCSAGFLPVCWEGSNGIARSWDGRLFTALLQKLVNRSQHEPSFRLLQIGAQWLDLYLPTP